ncbi:predicted protein [Phaeodactylum tricornutum CCAP 1055/1]|uniref:Oxidoreductase n=2 Tax=Phaeodactylum tricornutum TaxID=2850 RepID=B7FYX6_PHATC|nr:predicted protein [Phaeodactylum tricornutum CCAP 1055/1]EEC48246.1 predicted protein [Phaeodactylum tricornutum CCAP 1055/1]|eukprot:XP_002180055.1 predicted protein [Phaeodactylum tricornutum CCAP 1055/1]
MATMEESLLDEITVAASVQEPVKVQLVVSVQPNDDPIPQLAHDGITAGDLTTAIRVLNAVASLYPSHKGQDEQREQGLERYKQPNLRSFRKALAACLELHRRTMFNGKDEEEHYERRLKDRSLKRQKTAERDMNKKYIASTALRQGRVERLQQLQDDAADEERHKLLLALQPDGHVDTTLARTIPLLEDSSAPAEHVQLPKLRSCYVCKVRFRELHEFYDQLCPACAALNWQKRHNSANLHGRVAIVTGSRVKIGYQTCLKLLRAGCVVVATTRFPNAAAATYRAEADFDSFRSRLHVYGLDLRDVTGLEAFTRFLKQKYTDGIDILINNACQTVRRPVGYYRPQVEREQMLWMQADQTHKSLLDDCADFERVRRRLQLDHKQQASLQVEGNKDNVPAILDVEMDNGGNGLSESEEATRNESALVASTKPNNSVASTPFEATGLSHSAAMSQMVILPEDAGVSDSVLPPGVSDVNGQQLDLRTTNSWLLKMEEVSTPEILECFFINAIAPFVLNSRLKPLMTTPNTANRSDRYIINVSAMEGKFYRYKMPNHPHTNMAKAALNMLTRTSAEDLAKQHRIFMNSVDTGWINDENPTVKASKIAETNLFQTPIDEIDAAARILDPIFEGVNGGTEFKKDYGKFLKDYRESEW